MSLDNIVSIGHNQRYIFSPNVDLDIVSRKEVDGSHTLQFQVQTRDRRNYTIKSFNIPRDVWNISCFVQDNEVILSVNGERKPITDVVPEIYELMEWAENKILDRWEVQRFSEVSEVVKDIVTGKQWDAEEQNIIQLWSV